MQLHNKFIKQLLILFIVFFFITTTYSQDIVTVNIQQPPLNQLRVEHLWQVTLSNTSQDILNVYLYGTLTEQKDGTVLTATTSSINLSPGLKKINVHELEPISVDYPNSDSKYREALIRTGNMPSGEYEICVYVKYKSNNNNCGSDCIQHSIEIIPAPTLIYPTDSEKAVTRPLFTWMQAVRPGLDIRYKIRIVEIKDNQSPETAMKTNPAWFEESNIMTSIFPYPVSANEFADSGMYAWQIQSYGFSGNPLGENNGLSEIMSFMYIGKSIDPNSDVIAFPNDIDVLFPKVGEEIDADAIILQWSYKKESDSNPTYSIKIVEVLEDQSPQTAIKENEAFWEGANILDTFLIFPETDKEFIPGKEYAWQVSVYEGNSKIDECKVSSLIISAKKESELDVIFPKVGEEIDADAINFQWSYKKQSDSGPNYTIKVVEVLENQTLKTAIQDNPALWEQTNISDTHIQYPETEQAFIPGKKYAWQVSVFEGDSRLLVGEVSSFIISSEKNTELDVLFPKVGEEIDADGLILEWKNFELTEGSVKYTLKIVEVYSDQTPKTAIENNASYFEKSDLEAPKYVCYLNPFISFDTGKKYAWHVTVYKGGEIVGTSSVGSFIIKSVNE